MKLKSIFVLALLLCTLTFTAPKLRADDGNIGMGYQCNPDREICPPPCDPALGACPQGRSSNPPPKSDKSPLEEFYEYILKKLSGQ